MLSEIGSRTASLLLAVAVGCFAPTWAQTLRPHDSTPGPTPSPSPPCEQSLAEALAVKGVNSSWTHMGKYSTPLVPGMGFATADMAAAIDPTVANFMNAYNIPGGAVALTYKDNVIFAKSYGYVDFGNGAYAEPDSRFRVASVSKAITAMGVLKLVHDGQLALGDHPFPFAHIGSVIGGTVPGPLVTGGAYNTELSKITVNDLLHHAGGWNRGISADQVSYDVLGALQSFLKSADPPDCTTVMRYVESQPLDFTPGTEAHYSNVGFCALSELIREKSGTSYFDYMNTNVFKPLGMIDTILGATPQSKQADRESVYYDATDSARKSLFPPYTTVPPPYSNIGALEAQEGAGGIVSTAINLARFAGGIAGGKLPNLSGPAVPILCIGPSAPDICNWPNNYYVDSAELPAYECSSAIPPYPAGAACHSGWSDAWEKGHWPFGAGWDLVPPRPVAVPLLPYDNYNFIKDGGYEGTVSSVAATADGYGFAAVFNQNDNTIPAPQNLIFWPGCATPTTPPSPIPAASDANCALQAAYNHTTVQAWNVDFSAQYSQGYSNWMGAAGFETYLAGRKARGMYPSRLEGRMSFVQSGRVFLPVYEYRARIASASADTPAFLYGQTCSTVLSAIESAPASTPLVSLQRFSDSTGAYLYQAVWSAPIPQLP
jgi:CubicO group peptidase (beta-lactamase class C family)